MRPRAVSFSKINSFGVFVRSRDQPHPSFFCTHAVTAYVKRCSSDLSLTLPAVQTVGSLDAVNVLVGREGLQKRVVLPRLVVEAAAEMPPKRRVVGGASHALAKHRPKSSSKKEDGGRGGGAVAHKIEEKGKPHVGC